MSVQLATLDILMNEAHFEPVVARAIGAAIENELRHSQFVTEAILDSRVAKLEIKVDAVRTDLKLEMSQLESRLLLRMAGLGAAGIAILFSLMKLSG
jgi:hypothetical protein